jgi:hypothetical protein
MELVLQFHLLVLYLLTGLLIGLYTGKNVTQYIFSIFFWPVSLMHQYIEMVNEFKRNSNE